MIEPFSLSNWTPISFSGLFDKIEKIEIKSLEFSYIPEKPLLKDFSISLKRGQKAVIKGATGKGKTTIFRLLMKMNETEKSSIFLNGLDIKSLPSPFVRQKIALAGNEVPLSEETLRENLLYGVTTYNNELFQKCLKYIGIEESQLDAKIQSGTIHLSEGEKQKISVARALLREPEILLLDEVCSSIDNESVANLLELISQVPVVIAVSRKPEIIAAADIVVLI